MSETLLYRNEEWLRNQFELYKTPTEVAKQTGFARTCITRYATKFGIYQTRGTRESKLHIRSDYFKKIDSSNKAYFLGFIMADGCMYQKKDESKHYQFSIKIQERDVNILEKFCEEIEFDKTKIRYRTSTRNNTECKTVEIQINNQDFCKDLINHGIQPQKSGKEYMPNCNGFEVDFIRGFIDGDGWVYKMIPSSSDKPRYDIGFCSTSTQIIKDINTFIKDTMNIEMTTTESKNVITSKKCAKYEVFKILNRIYYDDCLSLNRKNKVAQEIRKEIYNELF